MLPLTPTKLGRYEIVDEIGKGAMGVVYLARDPLIGRLVALKTFRIGYSIKDQEMEQFRIRFMREAQSAGILTHPNIVTIHDVVEESEEGLAFIAMEYVRGTNLKLLLQGEQPLALPFVLDIIAQVGDALDYAHSNRVIHRDVKPANILITTENRVKITDFGIARLDSSNLTQEGQLLGTPNYMAPEQIQGKEVDYRADLFSLGVVLYEMLTRHKPFQGENLTVVSHRIVYDHFTPPREYTATLPPGLDRVLAKALEKDPARRYQRAREMVDDLRRVVESSAAARDDLNDTQSLSSTLVAMPPSAVPPPPPPRPAKPSLFNRWRNRPAPPPPPPPPESGSGTQGSSAPPLPPLPPLPAAEPPPPAPAELDDTLPTGTGEALAPVPPPASRWLSPRWLLGGVGAAILAAVLLGAAVLLWRSWSQPEPATVPPPRTAAEARQREAQIAALADQAERALQQGQFQRAVALIRQAEGLNPGDEKLRQAREVVEMQARSFEELVTIEKEVTANIIGARQALAARNYGQAEILANLALGIDPDNEKAKAALAEAQKGLARQARRGTAPTQPGTARPGEQVATGTPLPGEAQPGGTSESTPMAAKDVKLRIRFQADVGATLLVRVDDKTIVRESVKRGGLFRPRKDGDFDRTFEVSPGFHEIRVYVTPDGLKAESRVFHENFRQGVSRHLEIYLSKSKQITAQLN